MKTSEKIAYQHLLEQGYKKGDIAFNPTRTIDFLCSDGKNFEVKSLLDKHGLAFTPRQWRMFKENNVVVIVIKDDKIFDVFPFSDLRNRAYKSYVGINLVKTTVTIPDDLWKRFLIAVIEERGGRKANEVIIELINKYLEKTT